MSATNVSAAVDELASQRVVLIEDDTLLAELLSLALRSRLGIGETRTFASGRQGLAHCLAAAPDLLIVDLGLPDADGRDIIQLLRQRWPGLRVLVLTGRLTPSLPGELLELGVAGFVHKSSSLEEMETAVRRVLGHGMFFSAAAPWAESARGAIDGAEAGAAILNPRERQVARMVAGGQISKEIAAQLELSPRTVEKIRAQILAKLKLRDVASLVRWCVRHGLV